MAKAKKTKSKSAFSMSRDEIENLDHETLVGMVVRMGEQISQLSEILQTLVREKHAPKTERFEHPDQLRIFEGEQPATDTTAETASELKPEDASTSVGAVSPAKKKKPGHGRNPMPSHIEHEPIRGSLPCGDDLTCKHCSKLLVMINEVIRNSRYEYKPASVFIQDFITTVFQCQGCGHTLTVEPDLPQTIENGTAGPGLIAEIATARFEDHMPLHRQEQRFARMGVSIARSTMVGWLNTAAIRLKPLYDRMHALLLLAKIIATDDCPVKVQDRKKKNNVKIGRVWTYRGDDEHPFNLFDYTEGRGRTGPKTFLKGYNRYLQGDCFSGNLALCAETGATFAACWAHARRYFIKALPNNKVACEEILLLMAQLFEIDRTARELNLSTEETTIMRQQESAPILVKIKKWLDEQSLVALPKSSFGKAVHYSLNNWTELNNYMLDGDLRLDNNLAEQEMKRIAIGKKNWYFIGSDDAGKHSAVLLSLISTCKRHGVNANDYLKDVLQILTADPQADLDPLLPQNWKRNNQNTEMPTCHTAPELASA